MINFNSKYTILVIVLVAIALLFATWGIYKKFFFTTKSDATTLPQKSRDPETGLFDMNGGGRKRRRTKKVNKK
jgi:hypothetical protein